MYQNHDTYLFCIQTHFQSCYFSTCNIPSHSSLSFINSPKVFLSYAEVISLLLHATPNMDSPVVSIHAVIMSQPLQEDWKMNVVVLRIPYFYFTIGLLDKNLCAQRQNQDTTRRQLCNLKTRTPKPSLVKRKKCRYQILGKKIQRSIIFLLIYCHLNTYYYIIILFV